jgi:hypothetical protein
MFLFLITSQLCSMQVLGGSLLLWRTLGN